MLYEDWEKEFTENRNGLAYTCGYCHVRVSPVDKLASIIQNYPRKEGSYIFICTSCNKPSFISDLSQIPSRKHGFEVEFLPQDISEMYEEARSCSSVEAYTATSLICRKILMNVAVSKGAETNKSFFEYVNYLNDNHFIPPDGRDWVDEIRKQGNEATHEINNISEVDALEILDFTGMLLKFIYEMPGRMNERSTARVPR